MVVLVKTLTLNRFIGTIDFILISATSSGGDSFYTLASFLSLTIPEKKEKKLVAISTSREASGVTLDHII